MRATVIAATVMAIAGTVLATTASAAPLGLEQCSSEAQHWQFLKGAQYLRGTGGGVFVIAGRTSAEHPEDGSQVPVTDLPANHAITAKGDAAGPDIQGPALAIDYTQSSDGTALVTNVSCVVYTRSSR